MYGSVEYEPLRPLSLSSLRACLQGSSAVDGGEIGLWWVGWWWVVITGDVGSSFQGLDVRRIEWVTRGENRFL